MKHPGVLLDILVLIGRVLFSVLFLNAACAHLAKREMMSAYAAAKGVPGARFLVPATGIQLGHGLGLVIAGPLFNFR